MRPDVNTLFNGIIPAYFSISMNDGTQHYVLSNEKKKKKKEKKLKETEFMAIDLILKKLCG